MKFLKISNNTLLRLQKNESLDPLGPSKKKDKRDLLQFIRFFAKSA